MLVDIRTVAWAALYLVLLILASIFTGGISTNAQFGSEGICLLYASDYKIVNGGRFFNADSPACGIAIGIGILGILLAIMLGVGAVYFLARDSGRAKRVILAFALVASLFALVSLIGASIITAGLAKSCSEFEKIEGAQSCGVIFSEGFFKDNSQEKYPKSLAVVKAAVSAGWLMTVGWVAYAAAEWWNWRVASQRWW
ncbi:hypothetical protein DFS34DRAFT_612214 [Phlyctochytrium arcticum]|nr:hypothetical protein DFS34DRAFT_612214 [Phlyctochytrium arcticum]